MIARPRQTPRKVGSPQPAPEEAARPSPQPSDQESDLEKHMSATQVVLGPMTPVEAATQPPAITLSTDSLPALGLITDANADHPTVPTTG